MVRRYDTARQRARIDLPPQMIVVVRDGAAEDAERIARTPDGGIRVRFLDGEYMTVHRDAVRPYLGGC